jgi:hypothetical protein
MARYKLYDDDLSLAKSHDEKIANGEYTVIRDLTPDEIEEWENLNAVHYGNLRAIDRAYRSFINHESNNLLDMTKWWERVSGRNRLDKSFIGMSVTRHNGSACIVQVNEDD